MVEKRTTEGKEGEDNKGRAKQVGQVNQTKKVKKHKKQKKSHKGKGKEIENSDEEATGEHVERDLERGEDALNNQHQEQHEKNSWLKRTYYVFFPPAKILAQVEGERVVTDLQIKQKQLEVNFTKEIGFNTKMAAGRLPENISMLLDLGFKPEGASPIFASVTAIHSILSVVINTCLLMQRGPHSNSCKISILMNVIILFLALILLANSLTLVGLHEEAKDEHDTVKTFLFILQFGLLLATPALEASELGMYIFQNNISQEQVDQGIEKLNIEHYTGPQK